MFENIIGNNENKIMLKNIVESNNISHSYIFSGISGIGKFLFAKEFAKAMLCLGSNNKPCNKCKSCESFETLNNPDIIIIDEQNESIKTEQIKELTNNVMEKPIQANKKIYIINNSENMTKEAQNTLLKTLEEPPEYIVILLVTSNENSLLNTIKSRCIKISFSKLSNEEIKKYFEKNSEEINQNMLEAFNGSIKQAIRLKDKSEVYEKIEDILKNIETMNELQILKLKDVIFNDKEEIDFVLEYINTIFYNKLINNIGNMQKYERCIEIIELTKSRLNKNSNYDMTIDNCLLEIERSLKE